MGKVFSISGLIVALVLLIVFGLDVAMGDPKGGTGFPFMGFSKTMDVGLIAASLMLGYLSFSTYRELP